MFKELLTDEHKRYVDERIDTVLSQCAKFADAQSELRFRSIARFWLSIELVQDKYEVVYENSYHIEGQNVYIQPDRDNGEISFPELGCYSESHRTRFSIIECDAYKDDFDDENEEFKMAIRDVDYNYFINNIRITERTSKPYAVIEGFEQW